MSVDPPRALIDRLVHGAAPVPRPRTPAPRPRRTHTHVRSPPLCADQGENNCFECLGEEPGNEMPENACGNPLQKSGYACYFEQAQWQRVCSEEGNGAGGQGVKQTVSGAEGRRGCWRGVGGAFAA